MEWDEKIQKIQAAKSKWQRVFVKKKRTAEDNRQSEYLEVMMYNDEQSWRFRRMGN